uniref:Uncharacterized protein n=1 Tax=Anguilla anguilla TaxID=7936 RepID=A0A0E9X3B3_ANGAN
MFQAPPSLSPYHYIIGRLGWLAGCQSHSSPSHSAVCCYAFIQSFHFLLLIGQTVLKSKSRTEQSPCWPLVSQQTCKITLNLKMIF